MSEWKKPERIVGVMALAIALLAIILPAVMPAPSLRLRGGPLVHLPFNIGGSEEGRLLYSEKFTGVDRIALQAANSLVKIERSEGASEVAVSIYGKGGGHYNVDKRSGILVVNASNVLVKIELPGSKPIPLTARVENGMLKAEGVILDTIVLENGMGAVEARVVKSGRIIASNSFAKFALSGKGGIKLEAHSLNGAVSVTGDYEYTLTSGEAEIGKGPNTVYVEAKNTYLSIRVRGQ